MKYLYLIAAVVGLLFAGGCASPEARIKHNPDIFARLSPADQQLIREGKVGIGFTPDMVKLSLGDPDRVFVRTDATGTNETWSYATYETDTGVLLYRGYYHRYNRWGDPMFPYYTTYPSRREHEYFRVIFANGVVSAIEQAQH